METVSNVGFASVFRAPLKTQQLLLSNQRKHKSPCSFMIPPNHSVRRSRMICCSNKVSESGIQEKPATSNKRASKPKDRMEEYNIAMKSMMRNPYEYHHDLGQFHLPLYLSYFKHSTFPTLVIFRHLLLREKCYLLFDIKTCETG